MEAATNYCATTTALVYSFRPHYAGSKAPATKLERGTIPVDAQGLDRAACTAASVGRSRKDGQRPEQLVLIRGHTL